MSNMVRSKRVLSIALSVLLVLTFTVMSTVQADAASKKKTVYLLVKSTYTDRSGTSTTKYAYNKKGLLKKLTFSDADYKSVTTYKRNAKGAPTRIIVKTNGKLITKTRNTVNKKGLVTKSKTYSVEKGKKTLLDTTTFKYYKNKKLKKSVYKADSYVCTRTFNKKGLLTSEVIKSPDYSQTTSCNAKGDPIRSTYNGEYTKGTTTITYEYDKYGNVSKQVETDKSFDKEDETETVTVDTTVYNNTYDKHKNIIKQVTTETETRDGKESYNVTSTETNKYNDKKIAKKYLKYLNNVA